MNLELKIQEQISLLNNDSLKDLQLFIDFLINKQKNLQLKNLRKTKNRLLSDIQRIPIPVDNVIINRYEIYEDDRI